MIGDPDDDAPPFDPMADVLFGAASLLVLALILIMPTVGRPAGAAAPGAAESPNRVLAGAAGLAYGAVPTEVPLDRILDDRGFAAWLTERRSADGAVELVVDADGGEAAFVAEPVIARAGIAEIAVVRLARSCGTAPNAEERARCLGSGRSGAAR